jgi:hypothetical protein
MATLDELRKHVLDDASELARTTGLATPLMNSDLDQSDQRVLRFLRAQLARHVVLVVCRLHEKNRPGPTGDTASIDALLDAALQEGKLAANEVTDYRQEIQRLKQELVPRGLEFSALMKFRHAELAHSLHRPSSAVIGHWPVWQFAHDTYELVLKLDQILVERGAIARANLDNEFSEWRDLGDEFWKPFNRDEDG